MSAGQQGEIAGLPVDPVTDDLTIMPRVACTATAPASQAWLDLHAVVPQILLVRATCRPA
jgi:hypothetical protein